MERREGLVDKLLQLGLEIGVFVTFILLLVIETGYIAWLDRLPAFSTPDHSNNGFLLLPAWYENPNAPTLLLLTITCGTTVWLGIGLFPVMRCKEHAISRSEVKRVVLERVKDSLLWTILAGADLLFIQLLRT
jgi:hypothetical protein